VGGKREMRLKSSALAAAPSNVMEKVLLELGASFSGTSSKVCSVQSSATDLEGTSTDPKTSLVKFDSSDAVKTPSYAPLTQKDPV
jgi:hypothetical protein